MASLAARAGARIEERLPACDWEDANALFRELVSAIISERSDKNLAWYFTALDRRDRLIEIWDRFFGDFDALLMPPAMTVAFPHCEPGAPLSVDGKRVPYFGQGGVLAMGNLAGLPARLRWLVRTTKVCRSACRLSGHGGPKCVCWASAPHWNRSRRFPDSGRLLTRPCDFVPWTPCAPVASLADYGLADNGYNLSLRAA